MTRALIDHVNDAMGTIRLSGPDALAPVFRWKDGHYYASMNHNFQKRHEEDAVAEILDVMESMGWDFKFQYDTSFSSEKVFSESETSNELWIFHKEPTLYQIYKESVETRVGIILAESGEGDPGKIYVKRVDAGSLFEASGVPVGAVVMSINGVPCKGKSAKEAIMLITSKQGAVKLLTY